MVFHVVVTVPTAYGQVHLCETAAMTDLELSPAAAEALEAFNKALTHVETCRTALRKAVAEDLKATGATNAEMAELLPWSDEHVRGIAREYGVPPKRKATVRSIKPRRNAGGSAAG